MVKQNLVQFMLLILVDIIYNIIENKNKILVLECIGPEVFYI